MVLNAKKYLNPLAGMSSIEPNSLYTNVSAVLISASVL